MDVQTALRWLNVYETRCAARRERRIRMTCGIAFAPPNCFLALRTKEGSPLDGYVKQTTPGGRSRLAACKTLAKQAGSTLPERSGLIGTLLQRASTGSSAGHQYLHEQDQGALRLAQHSSRV